MEEPAISLKAIPRCTTMFSVDRAAFLLLRVKKAFKKKHQHRKDKQISSGLPGVKILENETQKHLLRLTRSNTLPAITVHGLIANLVHADKQNCELEAKNRESGYRWSRFHHFCSIHDNVNSLKVQNIPNGGGNWIYRRKSSDIMLTTKLNQDQKQYPDNQTSRFNLSSDLELHDDKFELLRTPRTPRSCQSTEKNFTTLQDPLQLNVPRLVESSLINDLTEAKTTIPRSEVLTTESLNVKQGLHQPSTLAFTQLPLMDNKASIRPLSSGNLAINMGALRRLSWERSQNNVAQKHSGSIDSFAKIMWNDAPLSSLSVLQSDPFNKQPSTRSLFSNKISYTGEGVEIPGLVGSRRESLRSISSRRSNNMKHLNDKIPSNKQYNEGTKLSKNYNKCCNIICQNSNKYDCACNNSNRNDKSNITASKNLLCNKCDYDNTNVSFGWSEQISHNVSLAKMSTAASRSTQDLKDMEYLLPQLPTANMHSGIMAPTSAGEYHNSVSISRQSRNLKNVPALATVFKSCGEDSVSVKVQKFAARKPWCLSSNVENTFRGKMSKKQLKMAQAQLEKLTQSNLHLHGLFSAVEHGHLEKARTILESTDVDVNGINSDGLSALTIAVLGNNRSMTKMLLQYGAIDNIQASSESIDAKLNGLLNDAESHIHDLKDLDLPSPDALATRPSISNMIMGNTGSSVTGCTGNESDKQIAIWERRIKSLRRLLLGWDQARPPDAPESVIVDVISEFAIMVKILEPFDGPITTKLKVQWSTRTDFNNIVGEREIVDWSSFQGSMGAHCRIEGLTQGRRYFIRAACGNLKGWGIFKLSVPSSIVPSSWTDLTPHQSRYLGLQCILDSLFASLRLARSADVSELTIDSNNQRRIQKKKTAIKQLFSVASKFQKSLRRGIYLASIIHYEDKILVTNEDFPPVIEIDEIYPQSLHNDFNWLMKVACTWDDVKMLRSDMERNINSAMQFRTKILTAICQMQSALGVSDLGQLYHKPLRDAQGTVVITCIRSVKSQKSVSILNSRWLPLNKLKKKFGGLYDSLNINEMFISSIGEQVLYNQTAFQILEPGLYLGYLKMQCSMDQIQILVPVKNPNVLPYAKVRCNSHITAEEWRVLQKSDDKTNTICQKTSLHVPFELNVNMEASTEIQRLFLYDLSNALLQLFANMSIKSEEENSHRLYDFEVIELNKDISFLMICPSVEMSCNVLGQSEIMLQRDDLKCINIQAFEIIHMRTYQPEILRKYARLSCILELDTTLANHSLREAFSAKELKLAKERLTKLQELTFELNNVWKTVRWLMDVVAFARDKNVQTSASLMKILSYASNDSIKTGNFNASHLLQLPINSGRFRKTETGRGSWPGLGVNVMKYDREASITEHSRSEQNLDLNKNNAGKQTTLQEGNTCNFPHNIHVYMQHRKNSGDSMSSKSTIRSYHSATASVIDSTANSEDSSARNKTTLPSSYSDDTLTLGKQHLLRHKTSKSTLTSTSSKLTPTITVQSSSSVPYIAETSFLLHKNVANNYAQKQMSQREEVYDNTNSDPESTFKDCSKIKNILQPEVEQNTDTYGGYSSDQTSGILQVYTAYNTGLASGTSLKLHVTNKTTAREVINLVVKQLNMAALLKGNNGPIYTAEMLDKFCLVAVIGARERCLRDDFKPLHLQNPWRKGRLYVRQKHELLAAIEHSNRKSHLI